MTNTTKPSLAADLDALHNNIVSLNNSIAVLYSRLDPVLRPIELKATTAIKDTVQLSATRTHVQSLAAGVYGADHTLKLLIDAIDL